MSRTIDLRLPFAKRGELCTLHTNTTREMVKAIADTIEAFAARRGVSSRAVEYDILG